MKDADIIFFSILAAIVVASVLIYFLIPVFNKKKYKQAREALAAREASSRLGKAKEETQEED